MSRDYEAKVDEFLMRYGIKTRAEWGARAPKKSLERDWNYTTVALHHSGHSAETDPKKIQDKHMNEPAWIGGGRGWDDVGYHFMIGPDGTVYEGRRLTCKGAHIGDQNTGKIGILVMGDFEGWFRSSPPSQAQLDAVTWLVCALKGMFALKVLGGHRDWDSKTECPGRAFHGLLPGLRKVVGLTRPP